MLTDFSSSPAVLPTTARLSRLQYLVTVSTRFKNTPACLFIYLVLILLNVLVMALEWHGASARHPAAITLEAIINVILVLEVATAILHQRSAYFHHWVNLIDLGLTVLCVFFFVLFLSRPPSTGDDRYDEIDVVLIIVRYAFQLTRISVLIWRGRKTTDVLIQDDIDFTVHEMRDKIDAHITEQESKQAKASKKGKEQTIEKQQLLDAGAIRSTDDDELHRAAADDGEKQHERAMAAIELQLKRHTRSPQLEDDDQEDHSRDEEDAGEQKDDSARRSRGGRKPKAAVPVVTKISSGVPIKRAVSPTRKTDGKRRLDAKQRAVQAVEAGTPRVATMEQETEEEDEDAPVDEADSEV